MKFERLFIPSDEDGYLYAIMEDKTIKRYDGNKWANVPSLQIKCPKCGKLLEPHICWRKAK